MTTKVNNQDLKTLRDESVGTSLVVIKKLAHQGHFASVDLKVPPTIFTEKWTVRCDGREFKAVREFYAPKYGGGWLVAYADPYQVQHGDLVMELHTGTVTVECSARD